MTNTVLTSEEIFSLGDFAFRFVSCSQERLDEARKLYASTTSDVDYLLFDLDKIEARVIQSQYATIFHSLITDAYRYHDGHLYIDGCALLTDGDELVLLAGASRAGKTTLTVAAAQKLRWKIVSEDLVLIAPTRARIVPFIHPLSLRPGAPQMIADATGLPSVSLSFDRWLSCHEMFYSSAPLPPQFSRVILLQSGDEFSHFSNKSVLLPEMIRALLPLSNALSLDNGIELLSSCIEQSHCSIVSGGTVRERLELLAEIDSPSFKIQSR